MHELAFAFSSILLLSLYSSIDPVILNTNSLLRRLITAHPWLKIWKIYDENYPMQKCRYEYEFYRLPFPNRSSTFRFAIIRMIIIIVIVIIRKCTENCCPNRSQFGDRILCKAFKESHICNTIYILFRNRIIILRKIVKWFELIIWFGSQHSLLWNEPKGGQFVCLPEWMSHHHGPNIQYPINSLAKENGIITRPRKKSAT